MTDLRERLDDLVTDVPPYVVPDVRRAWAAGARRRLGRRIGAGVAVVVLVALAAGLVGVLPRSSDVPPADGEDRGVDGYPSRIEKPWFLRDLPDRPGPLAAVIDTTTGLEWLAVSADGEVWRVPQEEPIDSFPPVLSDDGRMIGYLTGHTTYVLRDLVTGEETAFPEITDNAELRADEGTWWLTSQAPGFWSPDGSRLLLPAYPWDDDGDRTAPQLVLARDGSVEEARRWGNAAGWLDDQTLAWVAKRKGQVELVVTDDHGTVQRRLPIDVRAPYPSQWSAALSPDRSQLALVLSNSTGSLVTVSTTDGAVLRREHVGAPSSCLPVWVGDEPAFVQTDGEAMVQTVPGRNVMVVDSELGTACVLPAADALEGGRHEVVGDLLGSTWLSWHWQEVLLGVLGAAAVLTSFAWFLRRRGRRLRGA